MEKDTSAECNVPVGRDCMGGPSIHSSLHLQFNPSSLKAHADWSARHFSDFNDNRIMMIIPFTERTRCYLSLSPLSRFLSCSFILLCLVVQLFISIAGTCSRAWKAASCRSIDPTPAIVRSIDVSPFFFFFFFFFLQAATATM